MLTVEQNKIYRTFYDSIKQNDILDPKTTHMIHIAAALALGCYP